MDISASIHAMLTRAVPEDDMTAMLTTLDPLALTGEQLADAARAMLHYAAHFPAMPDMLDTCGTGGDGAHTRNVSTACAFVLAACGVCVVKHGNRAVSSKSGSADVLAALGINLSPRLDQVMAALRATNLAFLFAPDYHPNLSHVRAARARLGTRSIFNVLGPLCNPARVRRQLVGVYDARLLAPVAEALRLLGASDAAVVHAHDGLDEISISAPTDIIWLKDGATHAATITPEIAGIKTYPHGAIAGGDAALNAMALKDLLHGQHGGYKDAVLLNCAAALQISGDASDWPHGVQLAQKAIKDGQAWKTFEAYRELTL